MKTKRSDWEHPTDSMVAVGSSTASGWEDPTHTREVSSAGEEPADAMPSRKSYLLVVAGPHLGEMHLLDPARPLVIGRSAEVDLRLDDGGSSRNHARLVHAQAGWLLADLGSKNGTLVNGERVLESRLLVDGDKVTIGNDTIIKFCLQDRVDEEFQQRLREAALVDGLTQLVHRGYFLRRLEVEVRHARRYLLPLALLMIDVDHFKQVNDRHGHQVGDAALREVARRISGVLRVEDLAGRYGGEEFIVYCRGADGEGARTVAERIRRAVAEAPIDPAHRRLEITVSVGVALLPPATSPRSRASEEAQAASRLISAADEALYRAKHAGRDRVEVA